MRNRTADWFEVKVQYEKVQGNDIETVRKNIEEVFNSCMFDYTIASVAETRIMDVFEYQDNNKT